MLRKCIVALVLVTSLVAARPASAIPVDLDLWLPGAGELFAGPLDDDFTVAMPPPTTMGTITNNVYFDGTNYTYVHTVNPSLDNNQLLNTQFNINGFTGTAGWSFSDAFAAGGAGDDTDFDISDFDQLSWKSNIPPGFGWDAGESISFFFVSTRPPTIGDYNLIGLESGTAQSFQPSPVPEPGSIALLGSGLVGLYTAMRRRRSQNV
jgi:hypothetical protein